MKQLQFRPYTRNDKETCLEIFASNTPRYFGVEETKDFESFLERQPCPYFVIAQDNIVVACGGYGYNEHNQTVGLAWGMVRVDLHKHRLGEFLLTERFKQIYKDFGKITVQIDTSQHSQGFFKKYGFEATQLTENYYAPGIHRVDMEMKLTDERLRVIANMNVNQP